MSSEEHDIFPRIHAFYAARENAHGSESLAIILVNHAHALRNW